MIALIKNPVSWQQKRVLCFKKNVRISKKLKALCLVFSSLFFIFLTGCATLTPLSKAAREGDTKAITLLLSQGENINGADQGRYSARPLHWAARYGQFETAKLLIESGADINARDSIEQTPLMITVEAGDTPGGIAIAKLLISKGADTEAVDYQGWKFIHYARQAQNSVLMGLIAKNNSDGTEKSGIDAPDFNPDEHTINLNTVIPKIDYNGAKKVTIMVIDKRNYVVSGEKKPDYIGYAISNYYRPPQNMTTSSGKSLAEILTVCISESFKKAGFEVLDKTKKAERSIILYINEWISDAFYNIGFSYNLVLHVLDENGVLIDSSSIAGIDDLGSGHGILLIRSKILVPEAAKKRLTELFNNSKVKRSLQ